MSEVLAELGADSTPGQLARGLRKRAGLSLKQVAAAVSPESHFTTIAKLESGKMTLTYDWALRLAPVLGVASMSFFMPELEGHHARRIPVYSSLETVLARSSAAPSGYSAYLTSKEGIFGLGLSGPPDIGGEINPYVAVVDPSVTKLMDGYTYAVAEHAEGRYTVGVFRDGTYPRIVPWPQPGEGVVLAGDIELLGVVLELQRPLFSRGS